ncbi:MAG: hypothetical protein V3U20_05005 [Thermoplasmata archaeon]
MDDQLEFVKLIASRLDSVGIAYMMTGSMAMAVYSMPRMTRDIDLVIELDWAYMKKWAAVLGIDQLLKRAKDNE